VVRDGVYVLFEFAGYDVCALISYLSVE